MKAAGASLWREGLADRSMPELVLCENIAWKYCEFVG